MGFGFGFGLSGRGLETALRAFAFATDGSETDWATTGGAAAAPSIATANMVASFRILSSQT